MPTPRVTIDQLPEQAAPEDANLLVVHDGDTTKKMTIATLKTIETAGLSVHIADPTGAHAATAISATDSGAGVNGADVQAQLGQLAGRADTANAGLAAHLADTVDAHDASAISAVPHGGVSATHVQGQLEQLATTLGAESLVFDVRQFGAVGDNTLDCTTAIQAAIDAAAVAGGTVVFPAGFFRITDTLVLKTGVSLRGEWPKYAAAVVDMRGTWLSWGGGAVTKTMVQIGHKDQTTEVTSVNVEQIGILGGTQPAVTGISIGSNTRTNANWITTRVSVRRCLIDRCGVGLQLGSTGGHEQCDVLWFEQVGFWNCISAGLRVNAENSGDFSTFESCHFNACAPDGQPYVDLLLHGVLTFRNCVGGYDGTNSKGFIRRTAGAKLALVACQSEGQSYFLRTEGVAEYQDSIYLDSCYLDDGCEITGAHVVVSTNTKIANLIRLSGVGSRWDGVNDIIVPELGGRVVSDSTWNIFTNRRSYPDTVYTAYTQGEQFTTPPHVPTNPFYTHHQVVARSGRLAPLWAASTPYSAITEPSWKPSTAYTVDTYVTPTYNNTRKYRCTTAGTSDATEPNFKYGGTFTDGTVVWGVSESTTVPTYVLPRVDNGHVYKLLTAGTSAASEPTWLTAAGATVADGGCVWQETGASAVIRSQPANPQDGGTAVPTTGYFERGHLRWNEAPTVGGTFGWVCVTAGNPGTWGPITIGAAASNYTFVEPSTPTTGYLTPTVGTVTTPDPGVLPSQCTFVFKVRHNDVDPDTTQAIACQWPTLSWLVERQEVNGEGVLFTSPDGSASVTAQAPLGPITGADETLALSVDTTVITTARLRGWRYSGTAWTAVGYAQAGVASAGVADSASVMRIGQTGYGSDTFDGRIYSVELRTGLDPAAGSVVWRFDANDYPGTGTVYTDPRGHTWTLTSASAITKQPYPANAQDVWFDTNSDIVYRYNGTTWASQGRLGDAAAINAQTGTAYTLVADDATKLVTLTNAAAITVTVPTNATVAYPVGASVNLAQLGAGQVTVAAAGGVTVNATPTLKLRAQYAAGTLIKTAVNNWLLVGDLASS